MDGKLLIVDDERSMCELIDADLSARGYACTWFTAAHLAQQALRDHDFEAVLTDLRMPGITGLELCADVAANRPDIPVVVMTAFGSMEAAIDAMRAGAYDFITKPIEMDILALTMQRAVNHHRLQEQVRRLSEQLEHTGQFGQMLGESPAMCRLYDQLVRLADTEASVLILGESGTGKELVARSIHKQSRRRDRPFVAINCAALPEALLESELFGHVKGAFTDARAHRKGLFLQAEGGTLFLDEIGEMPLAMQVKLLRALEENAVRPVGGEEEIPFNVRVLAATNRDLETAIEEHRFREDLYYRINVIQLELPPLRARGTDVLLLAQHFLKSFATRSAKNVVGISEAAAEKLLSYAWPGNVRELRNTVERAVALTRLEKIVAEDLPDKIRNYRSSQVVFGGRDPSEFVPLEEIERRYVVSVLEAVDGNKTTAARVLGVDRKTLYRKLKEYGDADAEGGGTRPVP